MATPAEARAWAIRSFFQAIGDVGVDVGTVAPPPPGETRGPALWQGKRAGKVFHLADVIGLADFLAAKNAAGEAVFVKMAAEPGETGRHPGVLLVDDLTAAKVDTMTAAGWAPCAAVETSPGNWQAWVRLVAPDEHVTRADVLAVARHLAHEFGGDEKAVQTVQPGRLPGFLNRKAKYRQPGPRPWPLIRLVRSAPGLVAPAAAAYLAALRAEREAAAPLLDAGASPRDNTPGDPPARAPRRANPGSGGGKMAAADDADADLIDLWDRVAVRLAEEVRGGERAPDRASRSEVAFGLAWRALSRGFDPAAILAEIRRRMPDRAPGHAERTIWNAAAFLGDPDRFFGKPDLTHWRGGGTAPLPGAGKAAEEPLGLPKP